MSDVRLRVLVVAGFCLWSGCDEEVSSGEAHSDAGGSVEEKASGVNEVSGSVRPLYFVGRVMYAAPASKSALCPKFGSVEDVGGSSVEYLGGSTLGTVLSADESFVEPDVVQVRAPESQRLRQFYWLTTDGRGIDIAKPQGFPLFYKSSCNTDGVDLGRDTIEVWLRPKVDITISDDGISWTLDVTGPDPLAISVAGLEHPEKLLPTFDGDLKGLGIDLRDLPDVIAVHPFANGVGETLDSKRFVLVDGGWPNPVPFLPSSPDAPGPTVELEVDVSPRADPFEPATVSYTVPMVVEGSVAFARRLKEVVKDTEHWTWTNSSHRETQQSEEGVARIRVASPSAKYSGPSHMRVYYDTIFRSFAFVPDSGER